MPDIVNDQGAGALAAEFVLGTLDSDERARANERLNSDDQFRDLVRTWERRFGELHLMVEPIEPPAPIWDRIKAKIPGVEATSEAKPSEAPLELPPPTEPELTLDGLEAELRQSGIVATEPAADRPPEAVTPARTISAADTPALATPAAVGLAADRAIAVEGTAEPPVQASRESQSLRRWRLAAVVTTLVAAALAGLMAAWRYVPERLPPQLQAANVLNIRAPQPPPAAPLRTPPPPESQFDE